MPKKDIISVVQIQKNVFSAISDLRKSMELVLMQQVNVLIQVKHLME